MLEKRLKEIRKLRGFSQEVLSEKIGITKWTLINYEKGQNEPTASMIVKIAKICNINELWLLTGKGDMFIKDDLSSINVNNSKNIAVNGSKNTIVDNGNIVYKDKIKNDLNIDDDILEISKLLREYGTTKMKQDLKTKLLQIKALHDE